jgi:hypothetical protein
MFSKRNHSGLFTLLLLSNFQFAYPDVRRFLIYRVNGIISSTESDECKNSKRAFTFYSETHEGRNHANSKYKFL